MEQQQTKTVTYSLYDAHCAKTGCQCEHTQCYKGWINHNAGVWPCMYCREDLTGRLMRAGQARDKGYPQEAISRIIMGKQRTQ
jgi:hypothetical protein